MFFSEEKNQKTFISVAFPSPSGLGPNLRASVEIKVFLFFSSEKSKNSSCGAM
jgi:hypothetical protein